MSTNIWRKQIVKEELLLSQSLSDDAALAYHRLILQYRYHGGHLKDDDGYIARLVGFSIRRWKNAKPELMTIFRPLDGCLIHAKEDKEIAAAKEISDIRKNTGKLGAKARWKHGAS